MFLEQLVRTVHLILHTLKKEFCEELRFELVI